MRGTTAWSGVVLGLMLVFLAGLPAQDEGTPNPIEAVRDAARKLGETNSYSSVFKTEMDTRDGMMSRFAQRSNREITGIVDNKVGVVHFKNGRGESARKGKTIAVYVGNSWKNLDDLEGVRFIAVRKAPHEEAVEQLGWVQTLEVLKEKETVNEKECTVYNGKLTEASAKKIVMRPLGDFADRLGAEAKNASGRVRFWVDGDGILRKMEISAKGTISVSFREMDKSFDVEAKAVTGISGVNESKLDLPKEAKEILGIRD